MQVVEALRILEVSENTPWSTIKTRYKVLARKYHPDFNPGDEEAEELFRQLCTAYELLNNAYQGKVSAQQDTSTDQRGSSVPANPAKAEGVMRNIVAAAAARVRKRNEERHEQYKAGKRGGRGRGDDFFDPFDTIFPGSARASSARPHASAANGQSGSRATRNWEDVIYGADRGSAVPPSPSDILEDQPFFNVIERSVARGVKAVEEAQGLSLEEVVRRSDVPKTSDALLKIQNSIKSNGYDEKRFAESLSYAAGICKGKKVRLDIILMMAESVAGLTRDQMLQGGAYAQAILRSEETSYLTGAKTAETYAKMFGALANSMWHLIISTNNILGVEKIAETIRSGGLERQTHHSARGTVPLSIPIQKQAESMSYLMKDKMLYEAEALLKAGHWVGKTNLWIVSGSDMVSKTRFFEDMRSELRDRHGYTLRDFIELLDMAGIIYDSGEVRFDMRPISRARQFVSDLADLVPKEQHRQLRSFVGLVCMGARNYVHSGAPQASQEWVHAIENYFSTYKRSPILFRDAVLALKELKFNSYGELERWPGVVHLTVEAAAYAAHRLVEQTEEEPDFTDGFARLLLGYRASPYIKAPRPGSEKISLSPLEEETYQYLSSVQRGARDGIKTQPKRMLIHDVDRLFEIYEKHTGRL